MYWATVTPNLGAEMALSPKSTVSLQGGYNPWKTNGTETDNKKLAHWVIRPEYRYWLCERFLGHYVGGHAFYGQYNISGHKIPLLLESGSEDYRYKGNIYGVGISYGYHWALTKHLNIEFTLGVGYGRMQYDKFMCVRCSEKLEKDSRNYFGPTNAGLSLVYIIK